MKKSTITCIVIPDLRRATNDKKYPLKLRITFKGQRRYFGTGHSINLQQWDKINSENSKGRLRKIRNDIAEIENRASELANKLSPFNFSAFQDIFFEKPIQYESLKSSFEKLIQDVAGQGRAGSANAYKTAMIAFYKFQPKALLSSVNVSFLRSFENWMLTKGNSLTTVGIYARVLRIIINKAIAHKYFNVSDYPFGRNKYLIPAGRKAKRSLNIQELKKIFEYKPSENNYYERRSIDFWKLTYLANGINMADIARLKWDEMYTDSILFYRQKTLLTNRQNAVPIEIVRNEMINSIIHKWSDKSTSYIFNIISEEDDPFAANAKIKQFTRVTNEWMKKIGNKLGISTPLTTYVARHSFSTILLRSGASVEFISHSLGHSDIKVTQNYLSGFNIELKKERMKALTDFC
ncbi:tyrosine-type recombinase/integrase [Niabella insulamsoli]|uniref:tyrosine-type recombinase/integrase n=1 Tax=Niabella insulamsoli TaxID=3144874 RepID=UPI0031FC766C